MKTLLGHARAAAARMPRFAGTGRFRPTGAPLAILALILSLAGAGACDVRAECVTRTGDVIVRDAETDAVLEVLEGGEFLECSEPAGSSTTFTKGQHVLRTATCLADCAQGILPGHSYFRIGGGPWRLPETEYGGRDGLTCRHFRGDARKYCWDE